MKCAIEIPSELTWEIIKHHNAALRTSAHGVERLSAERGNVTNTHAYNASGFANAHTVDVQELEGSARAATVINGKKCSGTFRSQVGEAKLACAGRGDLEKSALARVSALHKAGRVARAK